MAWLSINSAPRDTQRVIVKTPDLVICDVYFTVPNICLQRPQRPYKKRRAWCKKCSCGCFGDIKLIVQPIAWQPIPLHEG